MTKRLKSTVRNILVLHGKFYLLECGSNYSSPQRQALMKRHIPSFMGRKSLLLYVFAFSLTKRCMIYKCIMFTFDQTELMPYTFSLFSQTNILCRYFILITHTKIQLRDGSVVCLPLICTFNNKLSLPITVITSSY